MTRQEKQQAAWWLCTDGLSERHTARLVGVAPSTVNRWLDPDRYRAQNIARGPAKRAWAQAHGRARCPCGTLMGEESRHRGTEMCRDCRREVLAVAVAWREQEIYELYMAGVSLRDIRTELGMAQGTLASRLAGMRAKGWDVPYRYPGWEHNPRAMRGRVAA
jgi:transposase-like protein